MPLDLFLFSYQIEFRDGDTIAVDWHYIIYEELLQASSASEVEEHSSIRAEIFAHENVSSPIFIAFLFIYLLILHLLYIFF